MSRLGRKRTLGSEPLSPAVEADMGDAINAFHRAVTKRQQGNEQRIQDAKNTFIRDVQGMLQSEAKRRRTEGDGHLEGVSAAVAKYTKKMDKLRQLQDRIDQKSMDTRAIISQAKQLLKQTKEGKQEWKSGFEEQQMEFKAKCETATKTASSALGGASKRLAAMQSKSKGKVSMSDMQSLLSR